MLEDVIGGENEIVRPDNAGGRPATTGIDPHDAWAEAPDEIRDVA